MNITLISLFGAAALLTCQVCASAPMLPNEAELARQRALAESMRVRPSPRALSPQILRGAPLERTCSMQITPQPAQRPPGHSGKSSTLFLTAPVVMVCGR